MVRQIIVFIPIIVLLAILAVAALLLVPQGTEPLKACTVDARICPDGGAVGRVLPDCEFAECPNAPVQPTGCPEDAMVCPDGSSVGRVPPDCQFADCPEIPAPPASYCGDGVCDPSEDCSTCEADCGECQTAESDPCDAWVGWDKKAECYSLLAQNQSDVTICERIDISNYKYDCYRNYAAVKADIPACMYLENQDELDCIKHSSLRGDNYTKCLGIPEDSADHKNLRYDCLAVFAKRSLDDEPCYLINHIKKREDCIKAVALAMNNLEGCLLLKTAGISMDLQYSCFFREANETKNVSICDNIDDVGYKSQCIYAIVMENRLMSNRCTGLSLDNEYLCRAIADDDYTLCSFIQDESLRNVCDLLWSCVDSDGGREYYEEGEVLLLDQDGKRSRHPDSCGGIDGMSGMTTLEEYYCTSSGGLAWETYICPNGCEDGECK